MIKGERVITETEAQEIAKKFLITKYFQAKIDFNHNNLIIKDEGQVYQLQGEITMGSRSQFDRFVVRKNAGRHDFNIEIGAQQGQIISYEFI